jgi:heme-degrading monooxygenase HmoA
MFVIVWEFYVRRGVEPEFERAYGPEGDWARLFAKSPDYLGTELLADASERGRYVTIDRWTSEVAYERFRSSFSADYESLDRKMERLTEREGALGSFRRPGFTP